jgi:hypothetical protein
MVRNRRLARIRFRFRNTLVAMQAGEGDGGVLLLAVERRDAFDEAEQDGGAGYQREQRRHPHQVVDRVLDDGDLGARRAGDPELVAAFLPLTVAMIAQPSRATAAKVAPRLNRRGDRRRPASSRPS